MSDKWQAGWMCEQIDGVERDASPILNVVKEFVTKLSQRMLEYRARE